MRSRRKAAARRRRSMTRTRSLRRSKRKRKRRSIRRTRRSTRRMTEVSRPRMRALRVEKPTKLLAPEILVKMVSPSRNLVACRE